MGSIPIKTPQEIEAMRQSGQVVAEIRDELAKMAVPGMTTAEIDRCAADLIQKRGARSAFLSYRGFPGHICISVNEEVIHGIGGKRKLAYGDLLKIDVGIVLNGWIGDTAITVPVGAVAPEIEAMVTKAEEALANGISFARHGNKLGDICSAIEKTVTKAGYSVVRDFVGHGVGRKLHEEPQIPNYGRAGTGPKLRAGMILAIEPMVTMGRGDVKILDDGWTAVTVDGKVAAHVEHTILVTHQEAEILTCSKTQVSS